MFLSDLFMPLALPKGPSGNQIFSFSLGFIFMCHDFFMGGANKNEKKTDFKAKKFSCEVLTTSNYLHGQDVLLGFSPLEEQRLQLGAPGSPKSLAWRNVIFSGL